MMNQISLSDIIDEMLSVEKEEVKTPTIRERFVNFTKRREIEKQIQDEIENDKKKVVEQGSLAELFLQSRYYSEIVAPFLKTNIKNSLQRILRDGETLTESQLKAEIAGVRKCLALFGSIRLKIIQAKDVRNAV